jgi:transposase
LDLSPLYEAIQSREGESGRPPPDPAVLLALWLYATIEGIGSARQLERLAQRDLACRWLAGGVPLNYHGLADFRVRHVHVLDRLLTESVTALVAEGVVSLSEIAVDGPKVRAHASRGSFKTANKLTRIEAAVERRLLVLKAEVECDPGGVLASPESAAWCSPQSAWPEPVRLVLRSARAASILWFAR